jgi:hypothetical protein
MLIENLLLTQTTTQVLSRLLMPQLSANNNFIKFDMALGKILTQPKGLLLAQTRQLIVVIGAKTSLPVPYQKKFCHVFIPGT